VRAPGWFALLAASAVLVGAGIFFARQDLSSADGYASVGSFFLALLGVGASMLSRARSRSAPTDPESRGPAESPPAAAAPGPIVRGDVNAHHNNNVVIGNNARVTAETYKIYDSPKRRRRRR
jgi:hypothetical protein